MLLVVSSLLASDQENLEVMLSNGTISMKYIDRAALRVLTNRMLLGELEDGVCLCVLMLVIKLCLYQSAQPVCGRQFESVLLPVFLNALSKF